MQTPDGIDLAVVVITHDHAAVLPACLESVRARSAQLAVRVLAADSGSSDGAADVAGAHGAGFLPGPNRGYAAACNRALAQPWVRAAPWVLFLNPDAELRDGTLAELLALAAARPRCGIAGPRQVNQHGELIVTIGREPTPGDYWRAARSLWSDWDWDRRSYESERRCAWVSGSAMLARRAMLAELGGFDERFFMYSEEVDLCTRARRAGWEVAYLPQVTVMHRVADRALDPHRERLIQWSKLLYIRKWFGLAARASMRGALVALYARSVVVKLRAGEPSRPDRVRLAAVLRFRRDRYGPGEAGA